MIKQESCGITENPACQTEENKMPVNYSVKPKHVFNLEEIELKKVEVETNVYLRILSISSKVYVDFRKFYKGYPTKRGIRLSLDVFNNIKDLVNI